VRFVTLYHFCGRAVDHERDHSGEGPPRASLFGVVLLSDLGVVLCQDNILFGRPFDSERYIRVISSCALLPDLQVGGREV
jgi:hypothetical protein